MKIAFYTDSVFSVGGVQRVLAVIAGELSRRHKVTIITKDAPEQADRQMYGLDDYDIEYVFVDNEVAESRVAFYLCKAYSWLYKRYLWQSGFSLFHRLYSRSSFRPSHRRRLKQTLRAVDCDIVVGVHAFLSLQLASVAGELNMKTIGWMHNSYEALFTNRNPYLPRLSNYFSHIVRNLGGVVVLSNADKHTFQREMGLTTTCIYNPMTVRVGRQSTNTSRRFLSIGRMEDGHKGFDVLIRSFAMFAQKNSDWGLDIVGEGPLRGQLESLAESEGVADRVAFHNFTSDVQSYYSSASVYILSSRWEGFALVMMEALSHGLPIIATNLPATAEVFGGKDFAILCRNEHCDDFADAMLRMASSDSLHELGEAARSFSDNFSVESAITEWERYFNEQLTINNA